MVTFEKGTGNLYLKGIIDFELEFQNYSSYSFLLHYYNESVTDLLGLNSDINFEEYFKSSIISSLIYLIPKLSDKVNEISFPKLINNNVYKLTLFRKPNNQFTVLIENLINDIAYKITIDDNNSVVIVDRDLKILSQINSQNYDTFVDPQPIIDKIHPKDKELFLIATMNLEKQKSKSIDVRYLDYSNVYKWKSLEFTKIESLIIDTYFYIVIIKDIDYINSLENELMLFKEKFDRLLRITRTVLWEVNSNGIFTYVSPNSELLWGFKPDDLIGKLGFYDIHPFNEASSPKLFVFEKLLLHDNEIAFEYPYQLNETKILWLFCFGTIEHDKDGNFSKYYGWDIDVTDRKSALDSVTQYSDELNQAITDLRIVQEHLEEHMFYQNTLIDEISKTKEELEKSNNEKDKFFSIIAHDLRSPFSGFLGLTKMLEENIGFLEPDELKELAKMLKDSANVTYTLLENLLEWSRIQRDVIKFEPTETNLFLLMSNVIQLQKTNLDKKNIEVSINIDKSLKIDIDPNMINTVLRNLISNAVKFTPKNGNIIISANEDKDFVYIQIKDSGIGIPESIKENLFNIGAKTSRKGTDGEASSGLGLLLCKEYVELHGGRIGVESQENEGSTFYFSLNKNLILKENDA